MVKHGTLESTVVRNYDKPHNIKKVYDIALYYYSINIPPSSCTSTFFIKHLFTKIITFALYFYLQKYHENTFLISHKSKPYSAHKMSGTTMFIGPLQY